MTHFSVFFSISILFNATCSAFIVLIVNTRFYHLLSYDTDYTKKTNNQYIAILPTITQDTAILPTTTTTKRYSHYLCTHTMYSYDSYDHRIYSHTAYNRTMY